MGGDLGGRPVPHENRVSDLVKRLLSLLVVVPGIVMLCCFCHYFTPWLCNWFAALSVLCCMVGIIVRFDVRSCKYTGVILNLDQSIYTSLLPLYILFIDVILRYELRSWIMTHASFSLHETIAGHPRLGPFFILRGLMAAIDKVSVETIDRIWCRHWIFHILSSRCDPASNTDPLYPLCTSHCPGAMAEINRS